MMFSPILSALALVLAFPVGAQALGLPHVLRTTTLGGEGGWDTFSVDSVARRIYLSRGTHVMVVDADSGKIVGDLPDTPGVHGIALAPDLGYGFTSNGRNASVTCFDLKTLKVVRVIAPTGEGPDVIRYDPSTKRVFTFNGEARSATAIDGATGAVVGTLHLAGAPEFAVADGSGRIFVNLEDRSEVVVFGTKDLKVQATWPLGGARNPTGLAFDAAKGRLYAAGRNAQVAVLDAKSGKLLATLPSGQGTDGAVWDASSGRVFASNGEGTLTVLQGLEVLGSVPTARGARTLALDERTHHVFLVTSDFGPAPAATPDHPHPRPTQVPGTFKLLEVGN